MIEYNTPKGTGYIIGKTFEELVKPHLSLLGLTNIQYQFSHTPAILGGLTIDYIAKKDEKTIGIDCKCNSGISCIDHVLSQGEKYKEHFNLDEYWLITNNEKNLNYPSHFAKIIVLPIPQDLIYKKAGLETVEQTQEAVA